MKISPIKVLWIFCILFVCNPNALAQSLTIFAASSLTDAFTELKLRFESQFQSNVILNFAASSTLAAQINAGAPADIFASADIENMIKVVNETHHVVFAKNKLVVISNHPQIQTLTDLSGLDYLLVLAAEEVPAGRYAREALSNLEALYGLGYADKVLENLVSNEANVRQAVSKVVLGEADVAIVYITDVYAKDLRVIEIPEAYNVRAEYPIAVLPNSQNKDLAQSFVDFVLSREGQDILSKYGFLSPE